MRELRRLRPALGTFVEVRAAGSAAGRLTRAVEEAFDAVARVHRLMSFHEPMSDVSRLNRKAAGAEVEVDRWTWNVLAEAQDLARRSGGRFDITIAPRLVRWGLLPRSPGAPPVRGGGDWRDIDLRAINRVRFLRPLLIDLGGIAKGFAVDRAVEALQREGIRAGLVNAGGDLRVFGDRRWPIHVRRPDAPGLLQLLGRFRNRAVATSAPYFSARHRGGNRISALVDPATGHACGAPVSVSVVADRAVLADALTKVVLVDEAAARPVLRACRARAIVLRIGGAVRTS